MYQIVFCVQAARKTGLYQQLFHELINGPQLKAVGDNCYDVVITSGSFVPGHLNSLALKALARILKSGQIFYMNKTFLYISSFNDFITESEYILLNEQNMVVQTAKVQKNILSSSALLL